MDHISALFNGVEGKTPHEPSSTAAYPICGICGEPHEASDCDMVRLKATVGDTPVLSKARLSLPASLQLVTMADGTHSVLAANAIAKGTRFGPYEAKEQFSISPSVLLPLKVFKNGEDDADDSYFKEYYLNTTNEYECNWMYFVCRAHNVQEQNLICFQDMGQIFYISVKDIAAKEHLKVWYAPYYGKLMKMGSFLETVEEPVESTEVNAAELNALVKKQQNIRDRKMWICKFCGIREENIPTFATHISEHYIAKLRKCCELCDSKFQTTKALNKHIFFQHNDSIKHPKLSLDITSKQSTNTNHQTQPDPLLNDVHGGDNVLLEHLNFQDGTSMPNDTTLQLNVDTILNEDENFNFEMPKDMDKEAEKFVCDICLKEFAKLKFLVQHLNAHTGRFTCQLCRTVFTRKENYVAHKCLNNTSTTENKCGVCGKMFTLSKYLKRHMSRAHGPNLRCANECKKLFASQEALDGHSCAESIAAHTAAAAAQPFTCQQCAKVFGNLRNLTRHLKTHERNAANALPAHICEICSNQFSNMKALKQHLNTHKEPEFKCNLCEKSFQRRQHYLEHMDTHKNESPHTCHICNAKFTQKKSLNQHLLQHTDEQTYTCNECPQRFRLKSNLAKHIASSHVRECRDCNLTFSSADEYKSHMNSTHAALSERFECPVCKTRVKLRSSLKRHVKQKHGPDDYDWAKFDEYLNEVDKKYKEASTANASSAPALDNTVDEDSASAAKRKKVKTTSPKKKTKKVEILSDLVVHSANAGVTGTVGTSASVIDTRRGHEVQMQVQSDEKLPVAVAAPGSQEEAEMLNLLQVNNAEVMQNMASSLQLDEIVNVLGGATVKGGSEQGVNAIDYGNIAMEFENTFVGKAGEIGMTHTFDGESVCLSMPELNEHGQPVSLGDNIQSSFILENASMSGPVEQVVLYILDQKPS